MSQTSPRFGRFVLRIFVLLQLIVLLHVVALVTGLIGYGSVVEPALVLLVSLLVAAALVAMRATFIGDGTTRGHRIVFMAVLALAAAGTSLAGATLTDFVPGSSPLPPNSRYGPEFVVGQIGLEILAAAALGAIAALLSVRLLPAPPRSSPLPFARPLRTWIAACTAVAMAFSGAYTMRFDRWMSADGRLERLLASPQWEARWKLSRSLLELDLAAEPEMATHLAATLASDDPRDRSWAAYLLVGTDSDADGRAMTALRDTLRGREPEEAARLLSFMGADAKPAVPELTALLRVPARDRDEAQVQVYVADALGRLGDEARSALPALVDCAGGPGFPVLRLVVAKAIDNIDPGFAKRCAVNADTMMDAVQATELGAKALAIREECATAAEMAKAP